MHRRLISAAAWLKAWVMKPLRTSIMLLGAVAAAMLLSACSSDRAEVLKSPCVGLDDSPCGPKRPVNGMLNPGALAHS